MPYDYSTLFASEDGISGTWREVYNDNLSLPQNVLNILKQSIFLPHDFYDIVAAYCLLPSALCRVIPYLFFYGQSGSGKSTTAKLASYVHGVTIDSSGSTFAAIRNSLDQRRQGWTEVHDGDVESRPYNKAVERNTCMIWDDIDASVFTNSPDLYRMFKFGYDRRTDKIIISSKEVGENLEFHCFCPKIFSSISPLHLDDRFRELKRRLIVIPCKRVEELSENRKDELGITKDDWQSKLIDIDAYNWKGLNLEFDKFWDLDVASSFLSYREILGKTTKGLNSQQRAISLDLLACGIATGIWSDDNVAVQKIKSYWNWFGNETEKNAGLGQLLKEYLKAEERNALANNNIAQVSVQQLRYQIDSWVNQGWLLEKPKTKEVKEIMLDLGMRLQKGIWRRG